MNQIKSDTDHSIKLLKNLKEKPVTKIVKEVPLAAVNSPLVQTEGPTTKKNLPEGYTRLSVFCSVAYDEKIRAYAYWERITMREFIDILCSQNLSKPLIEHDFQAIIRRNEYKKRITLVMKEAHWEKIKEIAWLARCTTRDVFAHFLDKFFADKEISPIPS